MNEKIKRMLEKRAIQYINSHYDYGELNQYSTAWNHGLLSGICIANGYDFSTKCDENYNTVSVSIYDKDKTLLLHIEKDGVKYVKSANAPSKNTNVLNKEPFYFTFGSNRAHPFNSGWVTVYASSLHEAVVAFKMKYGVLTGGLAPCADIYNHESFKDMAMYVKGNCGARCHYTIFA